jgi:hypothetical protein
MLWLVESEGKVGTPCSLGNQHGVPDCFDFKDAGKLARPPERLFWGYDQQFFDLSTYDHWSVRIGHPVRNHEVLIVFIIPGTKIPRKEGVVIPNSWILELNSRF